MHFFSTMTLLNRWTTLVVWSVFVGIVASADAARAADETTSLEHDFDQHVKPFLTQHCERCHSPDKLTSGIRVDQLSAALEDRHLKLWGHIQAQLAHKAMPPEDEPQPSSAERQRVLEWIRLGLEHARTRPTPKNGVTRRLTVAQYRNTLRELLLLEDNLTDVLPPDAVSKDGFVNNNETLALSPLLLEAYFDIVDKALQRCLVDPNSKPVIQHFRVDLGANINPDPCPDKLVLGARNLLLDNEDLLVTQPRLTKPFDFDPLVMRSKWRFNEGYVGNGTVRGWRDFDSIYHAVFACLRGANGYPKGEAYSTVPQGLLLRPALMNDENFRGESAYGPKANFKVSVRELPDDGLFRVTVTAAKYNDGLLIDRNVKPQPGEGAEVVVCRSPSLTSQAVTIKKDGIYQVDIHLAGREEVKVAPEKSRLNDGLIGVWALDGDSQNQPEGASPRLRSGIKPDASAFRLMGDAKFVKSPLEQAVSLDGTDDAVVVPSHESLAVGTNDFTIAAWIHPQELRPAGIVSRGKADSTHGWYLDMPSDKGILRFETFGPDGQSIGSLQSPANAIRANTWQHVAVVVQRGKKKTQLFVNGSAVSKGSVGKLNLDNAGVDLLFGRLPDGPQFRGELDDVRIYRRALASSELEELIEPNRQALPPAPKEKAQQVTLLLGVRQFVNTLYQPAFVVVRLAAGELPVNTQQSGATRLGRVVFTPLPAEHELAKRFVEFERRSPQVGVHLGFRRDCGTTLVPVGAPQTVSKTELSRFVFEGAMRNVPSPELQKDNDNYLAGVREIAVRSENTDGRDMPQLLIRSVEFEGPFYDSWPPKTYRNIFGDPGSHARQSVGDPDSGKSTSRDSNPRSGERGYITSPAYAREVIRDFATRALRRPITAKEEAALLAVFQSSFDSGIGFQPSVKDALHVVLTSPQFLFLIENSNSPAAEPLNDFELASKLSYFLWNGPPDQAMLALAAKGQLRRQLDAEIVRLIADPRSSRFVTEFASQWLALDKFRALDPDRSRFPKLTRITRGELQQEPVQFLQHLIRNNLPARNLIESEFVVANEVVASYYDLTDRPNTGFGFVAFPHERQDLGGIFGQAAIMAGLSDGRESNPVKRGAWLARRIVAEPPDDPPPNVPALKEAGKKLTLRERLERHRNQPGCAQCHSKIDPWGVPFEEFDAGGRFKLESVDARSTLPDKTDVAGVSGLKRYLAEVRQDQVAFSVLKHLTIYANGRSLTFNETELLKRDGMKLKANGYRMQDMIRYVVNSPMFLEK